MIRNMIFLTNLLAVQNLKKALKEKQKFHTILTFRVLKVYTSELGSNQTSGFSDWSISIHNWVYIFSLFLNPCSDVL